MENDEVPGGVLAETPPHSIDEVLAGAMWVENLTDPALCFERLHETFIEVIFSCVEEKKEENEERVRRLKTAAERRRDMRVKEDLRRALLELQDDTCVDEGDNAKVTASDGEDDYDDDLNSEIDFSEESQLMDEGEFLSWISRNDTQHREERITTERMDTTISGIENELRRIGLGEEQHITACDRLPERLKAIEIKERRPGLGSRLLHDNYTYKIPLEYEAFWILRQLRVAGQPLSHNTRVCAIATRSPAEVVDEPLVVAIAYALQKMTQEYLEPAHLMLYHQTPLHPLMCALLEASPFSEAAECALPVSSYAYSAKTGRRQRPFISDMYVGFGPLADRPIGEGDPAWDGLDNLEDTFAQRKPCFIELGRLLVRILELDMLCHRLESQRQHLLLKLKDHPESYVQNQRVMLEGLVFDSSVEADFWQAFVNFFTTTNDRGVTQLVRALGLEDPFEEYSITGLQYQENLVANAPIHTCQSPQSMSLMEWAQQVGAAARIPRSGEEVLSLFNQAIVEQFSKLPVLRKRLLDVFCAEGDLIVTYKYCKRKDEVYSLATFFVEHPRHYLSLLEREHEGSIALHYVINEELVRREMNLRQLYDRSVIADEWSLERERAMELLLVRLVDGLVPKVQAELSQFAHNCVQTQAVERLGIMCSQGPYERTRLCLEAYDDDAFTWEPEWNVVEALPIRNFQLSSHKLLARVCAAYCADNGVTHLSFIDEIGSLIGYMRWTDCTSSSEVGRAAEAAQSAQLEKLCARCDPSVFVVGASNTAALSFMRSFLRFLRERVYAISHVEIPVVWAPVAVARLYSSTSYAALEISDVDATSQISLALARYVQDPLYSICALFDKEGTALRLSLGAMLHTTSEQEEQLYTRLCWEMSLWVTACGLWVEDCIARPMSITMLQFLAGFGPLRAQKLQKLLTFQRPTSREECDRIITEWFGDYVAQNATSSLRLGPPESATSSRDDTISSSRWHILDQTLIPLQWYGAAAFVAKEALKRSSFGPLTLVDFMSLDVVNKRRCIDRNAHPQDMITAIRKKNCIEWKPLLGEREVELLEEEMIAAGRSFLRRPYRRMSHREVMACLTGIIYFKQSDVSSSLSFLSSLSSGSFETRSLIICEGDYVKGTVQGIRGNGAFPSIRLATSFGLSAFILPEDIDNETMKQEFISYEQTLRDSTPATQASLASTSPSWLRRGAPIQGFVLSCNWERCELRLRWCQPQDAMLNKGRRKEVYAMNDVNDDDEDYISYAAGVNDMTSSANSVCTVRMNMDVRVFATKISRHPLFRDSTSSTAHAYLRDKKIGEVILRPASGRRSKVIAVVKVGERSMCNWLISEERRANGAIYYHLHDKVTGRDVEFCDVDEFLNNFIGQMVALVQNIRGHRRFVESTSEVQDALDAQRRSGLGFAYVFTEVGQQSRPPFYSVITRGGTVERSLYLHVDDSSIYVRIPIRRGGGGRGCGDYRWVRCQSAEHVSEVVKSLARPR